MKLLKKILFLFVLVLISVVSIDNVFAVDFKDHTGYTPEWALDVGEQQALMTCINMEYGTPDQKWCVEYSGYFNDKVTKELEAYENQDYADDFSNPNYTPQFNQKLFLDTSKKISYGTLSYINELYGFFISPPKNWSQVENVELIGGEQAAPVGFYSNDFDPTYTANFIIVYANLGSSYFNLLRFSPDKNVLEEFADGYTAVDLNSKITNDEIESFLDGYKIIIDSVHTIKLDDKKFVTLKKETIVFILESGEMYSLIFASTADDFDNNVDEFRKSAQTFHVGDIEFENTPVKQTNSYSESICGTGTIEKDGKCVVENIQSKGGGCLIATATYGSELAPQVQQLRELRDNSLLQTTSGTSFMAGFNQFYY